MPLLSDKPMIVAALDSGAETGGDAGNYLFATRTAGLVLLSNDDDDKVYYRVHDVPGSNEATATVYDGIVPAATTHQIDYEGQRGILGVSIWFPASSGALIRLVGIPSG